MRPNTGPGIVWNQPRGSWISRLLGARLTVAW
jgi:hypothetical protein